MDLVSRLIKTERARASTRRAAAALVLLATPIQTALAQSNVSEGLLPAFESASVLPSRAAAGPIVSVSPETGEFVARGVSVLQLAGYAYDVKPSSIAGAPEWMASARYQVKAYPPRSFRAGDTAAMRLLVKGLLSDYFGLQAHEDQLPIYILDVARTGTRIQSSTVERPAESAALRESGQGRLQGRGVNIASLAASLEEHLSRPVLDHTGLTDLYDLELIWDPSDDASLAAALHAQLGLTLRSVPVEVVVIDEVNEQPAYEEGGGFFEPVSPP